MLFEDNGTGNPIIYYYGVDGVIGFRYKVTDYYYRKNIQGDVIEIYTYTGTLVASYVYDAWGNILKVTEHTDYNIGYINPIRYRSYYYDKETGLYYLNSRYYDPETGRFISPDSLDYLDPETLGGINLYSYCNNNPVMFADPSGHFVIATFLICLGVGIATGAVLGAVSAIQQETDVWRGILTGALLGGIIGAAVGLALAGASGGIVAGIGKSFLKAGAKSASGKFIADLTAYICFGKEIGSLESYMSAFAFGGTVGALGIKGEWKDFIDVVVRPAYSILIDDMLFKGGSWSDKKYWTNVIFRGITCGIASDLKPICRGMLNGYNQYKSKFSIGILNTY